LQDVEKTVGKRISDLRLRKGITQDDFANLSGLNRTHLYRIESGKQSATLKTLKAIADALDVKIRDLVKDV
jgi:transcriptional regulator with XRE-family HTH domain